MTLSSGRRADLLLIAATLTWGVSFVVVKDALAASSPLLFLSLRFVIAAAVLAPLARLGARPAPGELAAGLLLTILLATGFAAQAVGLQYTTPARSAFIVGLSSVLAPVVGRFVLRHRIGWLVGVAVGIAGVGIYLLTAPDAGGLNRGDLWTLITAVVFGGHIVAVTELSRRYDARRLVLWQIAGTAVGVGIAALVLESLRFEWSLRLGAALVFTGVLATAAALVWQMRAQREMSSTRAALLLCFEPVFAAVTSWIVLDERFSALQIVGGGLIVAAMMLAALGEARAALAGSPTGP